MQQQQVQIPPPGTPSKELVKLVDRTLTILENAKRLGRSSSYLSDALKRHKIRMRTVHERPDWWKQIDPDKSLQQNGKILGKNPTSVGYACKVLGIGVFNPTVAEGEYRRETIFQLLGTRVPKAVHEIREAMEEALGYYVSTRSVHRGVKHLMKDGAVLRVKHYNPNIGHGYIRDRDFDQTQDLH